ncbi:cupin domain-containing protein [Candidatus Kaiserbacteria bacterium CG_4_9_14_3_um_filter_50_16]|uniref:Cupin domain-containing protein n=2 Tax=Candidatus Kaiseribacteriota TaxID=1752734 RepID=A0A2M7FBW8_9BACT|nr:MAG: cupin [Parcubacteria group bacterium CG1_02_50_68]PIS43306.1 MAG: cupin domain-containing protein [Candidatus Kaiserbacteria bacterium CG08_land_8_20_14_0_20_50_21]PIU82093.1 MAG: cupin domain-containing protein [Candidatus Kaiserbacteria bacterium CG06_land_8_20_14_3_00_49_31]PIV86736.1 MAG: cupin domain-containing protein [Candidatus Kaiserbacteria bacterium CG17_big_fil_post_rev_8_21_14_2_50_51_7]PIW96212.1 MAG: cupin domain-containing protein [Candidatus Kaiserbacteria bacterium CG_
MKGYIAHIEEATKENTDYRRVLYTAKHSQLVLMSLKSGEEIGEEVHHLDQFFRFESGQGKAIIDGVEHKVKDGDAVVVPKGARHNIVNTGSGDLKLYTLYSPPNHKDGTVQATKADEYEEEFDGVTTE